MTVVIVVVSAFVGLSEARGSHVIKYSRFCNTNSPARSSGFHVYTRTGMFAFYTPSFLIGVASFWISPAAGDNLRFFLIRVALTIHFLKRILEVMFVHKYSGLMSIDTRCLTSVLYALTTGITIYVQFISLHLPKPGINLIYPGVVLFLIGISRNFYHHLILARLRDNRGNKEYAIPHGGLFNLVLCPHYLFEIIDFIGLSLISQTTTCCALFPIGSMFYLMGRSYATRRWYLSKFDDFPPRHVCFRQGSGAQFADMMTWPAVLSFMFVPPPSAYVTVVTAISMLGSANAGLSEVRGANMKYSKFTNVDSPSPEPGKDTARVSSRTGMLVVYTPALIAAAAGFMWILPTAGGDGNSLRLSLITAALAIHFLKRVLEVLFVHKFSGFMGSSSMCIISLSYFLFTVNSIYVQYLSRDLPEPSVDLMYPGIVLFLIGIAGNFYHHIILSRLRNDGGVKEYKIPQGGLFGLVTCPHYLFEVIDFIGLAFISQTVYSFASALGTIGYLMGRSYATRRWYVSKFEDYPRRIKAIFPFIF